MGIALAACAACTAATGATGAGIGPIASTDAVAATDNLAGSDAPASADAVSDGAVPSDAVVASDALVAGDVAPAQETAGTADTGPAAACKNLELSDLFQKKIKPLVTKGQPTSCNQCHLSGVDLGLFVQDTPCKSMACMESKGLVDFGTPANSQVLTWIAKAKPESKLITSSVQTAEYNAFLEWITWSAQCQASTCGPIADPCNSGALPPAPVKPMIGACDEATLVASFNTKVFKWKSRCDHCHSPAGKDTNKSFGGFKPTPFLYPAEGLIGAKFTMYNVIGINSLDVVTPVQSTLLTKPLAEDAGGVWHGGGDKFEDTKDKSYIDFLAWIQQFAACKGK